MIGAIRAHLLLPFAALALVLALAGIPIALGLPVAPPIVVVYPEPRAPERITPITLRGVRYLSTSDLARVFRATKYWRPELRKLSMRLGEHTIRLTVDSPIILVDEAARNIVYPPRLVQGAIYVPESAVGPLIDWGLVTDAVWDGPARMIRFRSPVHTVRQAQLWVRGRVTEISATLLRAIPPRVLYATPAEVRLLFEGGTLDSARVFSGGAIANATIREVPDGVDLRLILAPGSEGYSLTVVSNRLRLAITDDHDLVQSGAFTRLVPVPIGGPDGKLRVVVLDPGHGGNDKGASLPGRAVEKDVALDLARALRSELQDRLGVRVILTRDGDSDVSLRRRAEVANESGGDLFISLHFDDEGSLRSGGFRVYTLSPTALTGTGERLPIVLESDGGSAEMRPWDFAQASVSGASMAVGQGVADALARSFPQTTIIFRTGRIRVLEPIASAAVFLECGPAPRGGPEAMSLQGYSIREIARTVAQAIHDLARGGRA